MSAMVPRSWFRTPFFPVGGKKGYVVRILVLGLVWLAPQQGAWAQEVQAKASALVTAHLGIFSTNPQWRDADERAEVQADNLLIWYRRRLTGPVEASEVCEAGRWLLLGRLDQTQGAAALFKAWPGLEAVVFILYDVTTTVTPAKDGRYAQRRGIDARMRILANRSKTMNLSRVEVAEKLAGTSCSDVLKSYVSDVALMDK